MFYYAILAVHLSFVIWFLVACRMDALYTVYGSVQLFIVLQVTYVIIFLRGWEGKSCSPSVNSGVCFVLQIEQDGRRGHEQDVRDLQQVGPRREQAFRLAVDDIQPEEVLYEPEGEEDFG